MYQKNYNNYLNYREDSLEKSVNSVVSGYTDFSMFILQSYLNEPEIKEIMWKVKNSNEKEKEILREELNDSVQELYKMLLNYNFRQLQFHEVGGDSFLRVNSPTKYGDSLIDVRKSIYLVNMNQRPIIGFEPGRIVNGYRYVYPLFYDDEFVGSVEIEVSMGMVISELDSTYSDKDLGFMITKDIVDTVVFEDEQNGYEKSFLSDDYYYDKEISLYVSNSSFYNSIYNNQELLEMIKNEIMDDLSEHKTFSTTVSFQGEIYLIQLQGVNEISGDFAGYFYTIGVESQFALLEKSRNTAYVFTSLFIIFILFSIYFIHNKDKKIMELALVDQLTKLYNRRSFYEFANRENIKALRSNEPMCIAMLDIDYFKKINDTYGHIVGDEILKEFSAVVLKYIRKKDILARFGGEEFILLMTETTKEEAKLVVERIRKKVSEYNFKKAGKVTVSIGLSENNPEKSIDNNIEKADKALYMAKTNGRNRTEINW